MTLSQLVLSLATLNQHDSHSSSAHFLTLPKHFYDRSITRTNAHHVYTHTHTRSISCPGWVIVVALKAVTTKFKVQNIMQRTPTPSYPMAGETGLNKSTIVIPHTAGTIFTFFRPMVSKQNTERGGRRKQNSLRRFEWDPADDTSVSISEIEWKTKHNFTYPIYNLQTKISHTLETRQPPCVFSHKKRISFFMYHHANLFTPTYLNADEKRENMAVSAVLLSKYCRLPPNLLLQRAPHVWWHTNNKPQSASTHHTMQTSTLHHHNKDRKRCPWLCCTHPIDSSITRWKRRSRKNKSIML